MTILNTILVPLINILGLVLEPLTAMLDAILEPMLGVLGDIISPLLTILNNCLVPIFDFLQKSYEWGAPIAKRTWEWLKGFFEFVISNVKGGLTRAFEGIGDTVKKVWSGMKTAFKDGINFWINAINKLIDGVNALDVPEWVTKATGISGINLPRIPALANGGIIDSPGSVLVGEAGPEILNLPRGASVSPLGAGIDYDRLAAAIVSALREVAPELATNVNVNGNKDRIVDVMVEANRHSILTSGKGVLA